MNNDDLNQLSNELLTAYFTNAEAEVLAEIADRYGIPITGKIFKKATDRAISWLETDDSQIYKLLNEANKEHMFQMGMRGISAQYGAVLGKDFSKTSEGLLINTELLDRVMADMPPEAVAEFKRGGNVRLVTQDPFKMLENSLGVPFFASLEAIVKLRFKTLSDRQVASYLSMLFGGLQTKHPWITDDFAWSFFSKTVGVDRLKKLEKIKGADDIEANELVFDDLLTALGFSERTTFPDFGMAIGRDELLALDKVFRGSKMSCAEMAEKLRRLEEDNRKK